MNRRRFVQVVLITPLLAPQPICRTSAQSAARSIAPGDSFTGTITAAGATTDERVVAYRISMSDAVFNQLPLLPPGWSASADNNADLHPTWEASTEVGAAALRSDEFKTSVSGRRVGQQGLEFEVKVEVDVTTDFTKVRTIVLGTRELNLSAL